MNAKEALLKINKKDWYFLGFWPQDIFSASFWIDWFDEELFKALQVPIKEEAIVFFNNGYVIVKDEEVKRMKRWIVANNNIDFWNSWNKKVKKVLEDNSQVVADGNLVSAYEQFLLRAKRIMSVWVVAVFINEAFELVWKERFSQEESVRYMQAVPKIKTPLFALEKKLHNLSGIKDIRREYAWIKTANFIVTPVTIQDLKDISKKAGVRKSEYNKLPLEIKEFLKLFALMGYTKQASSEYFSKCTYLHYHLLKKVCKKIGISYELMLQAPADVIGSMLKKEGGYKAIRSNWLLMRHNKLAHFITDRKLIKIIANLFAPTSSRGQAEIKGTTAFPGCVCGQVSIIASLKDFDKFKKGNILVSTMTTPDFLFLMKNAKAIVTDIGGLLCHAAVVAREISTPCVIGTKIATKVLKDGDEVEVDADQGIIKILN